MFDQTFSYVLAIAALVIGVMLLTGHGSVFMKGGNTVIILFVILAVFLFLLRTKCLKK